VLGVVFDRLGLNSLTRCLRVIKVMAKSLVRMIEEMDKLVPVDTLEQRTSLVLLDGGIASKANLGLLRKKHYHYLVNDSRRGRAAYRAEFLKEDLFTRVGQREIRARSE